MANPVEGVMVAEEVERAAGRGIGANVEVEDSGCGTRGQLVEGPVSVQVDENFIPAEKFKSERTPPLQEPTPQGWATRRTENSKSARFKYRSMRHPRNVSVRLDTVARALGKCLIIRVADAERART